MVMLNAYIVLETVNLNTMYLKNVNGFVDMWGVFSMKLSSQCSRFIHHQIICISHQARDLVRYMSSFVTFWDNLAILKLTKSPILRSQISPSLALDVKRSVFDDEWSRNIEE